MKNKIGNAILFFLLFCGICLLLYPSVSNHWNALHQTQAIISYEETLKEMDQTDYSHHIDAATTYNQNLPIKSSTKFYNGEPTTEEYSNLLNINNDSIMGYVEIPSIHVTLPIYHGTAQSVLSIGVGHLEGSSLPVGGEGTHCILSGHRGLTSAQLFTDLDKVREGDIFTLHILKEVLTYQVTNITIVEPHDIEPLTIQPDEDKCTLVTCTPYGVNSHRLLVSGQRVENIAEAKKIIVSTEAMILDPIIVAPLISLPILLILGLWLIFKHPTKQKKEVANNDKRT